MRFAAARRWLPSQGPCRTRTLRLDSTTSLSMVGCPPSRLACPRPARHRKVDRLNSTEIRAGPGGSGASKQAEIAQLVEQGFRKAQVASSSLALGSKSRTGVILDFLSSQARTSFRELTLDHPRQAPCTTIAHAIRDDHDHPGSLARCVRGTIQPDAERWIGCCEAVAGTWEPGDDPVDRGDRTGSRWS